MTRTETPAPRMLEGIRIADMTSVVFGPHATQMLADLGAEVIKIEPPGGEIFRRVGANPDTPTMGACHMLLNRGKEAIALDLKAEDDCRVMHELLGTVDVFIHNVRGKAMDRLGFGYEAVKALNPAIIYVHGVGFGSDGPYADFQAYDDVIQAASGTATLLPRADGNPAPRYFPSLVADKIAGHYGTQAVLAALVHKLRTGEGQFVEVPMFEAFTHFMMVEHFYRGTFADNPEEFGYPRQLDPNRQPFPTADGHISIVPYHDGSIVKTFELIGAADLLDDPRFATTMDRYRNITQIYVEIGKRTPAKTTAEWMDLLNAAGVPAMQVRDLADLPNDPHLQAVGFFREREHPLAGRFTEVRAPVRYGADPDRTLGLAPEVDQDGEAIRARLQKRPG
ncbi:CoA transferase [Novosphingobium sp. ZN18A2]|uniref:CaiB/BaiF CoA transferase family protein n=1 Tax=Novosphingobium sp. ZN18A2 TaxID=3079861 RepID=UPI0030D3887B